MNNKKSNLLNASVLSIPVLLSIVLFRKINQNAYTHIYGEGGVYVNRLDFVLYLLFAAVALYAVSAIVEKYFGYVLPKPKIVRVGFSVVFAGLLSALVVVNLA